MEEANLAPTDSSENPVLLEDKGNSNTKKLEKSGGSKLETGKSEKLKPTKKPASPAKPSISGTKNLTKPSVKSEPDSKSKTKPSSLSNGKPKHEEKTKPTTSHNVVKEISSNKPVSAPAQSAKKTTSATSTTNSKASPTAKTVKAPVETKQKQAMTKKPVATADDVHEATKVTPESVSKVNQSKSESNSSSKPKVMKSKPLVESSKEANPKSAVSKPIKSNVIGSAKPLTKPVSDVKSKPKPPSAKVSEKPAPVKSTTVSKPSQPGKVVKKPAKENTTKKSKGDSKKIETKSEPLHVTNEPIDTLTEVTNENSSNSILKVDVSESLCKKESCEVIEQLASNLVLNEEKNFDVFLKGHEKDNSEENLQLTESSIPDEISSSEEKAPADDEAPAAFTNLHTYLSSEEAVTVVKSSTVNDSNDESVIEVKDTINHSEFTVSYPPTSVSVVEYKEDNEGVSSEDRKQKFLVVADPTSSYDEASSKPIFSTSLDEPMDSETKDLETLQSHIISESTEIAPNEEWHKSIKDGTDNKPVLRCEEDDDNVKTGHALNFGSIDSVEALNVKKNDANLERNDIDLLDYLSVEESEMKPVENENDNESEKKDDKIPNYLSVNKNEFEYDNEKDDCKSMSFDIHDHFKDDLGDVHGCSENEGDNIHSDCKNEVEDNHDFCVDEIYNIYGQSEENIGVHNYCKNDDTHSSCEDDNNDTHSSCEDDNDDTHSSCEDDNDDIHIQNCLEKNIFDQCEDDKDVCDHCEDDKDVSDHCEDDKDVCDHCEDDKNNIFDHCEEDKDSIHDCCEDDKNIFFKHGEDDDDIFKHCEDLKNHSHIDNLGGDSIQNNSYSAEKLDKLVIANENEYVDVIETIEKAESQSTEVTSITISYEDDQVSTHLEKDPKYVGFDSWVSGDLSFENITGTIAKVNITEIVDDNCDKIRDQKDIRYDTDSDFENCKIENSICGEFDTKLGICINTELLNLEETTCSTKSAEEAVTENNVHQACAITNTNIFKEYNCPQISTDFLDNNYNVLQKNSVKYEISDTEQNTETNLENTVNDFTTIDNINQSCDEKLSECIYNKDLHHDVFGSITLSEGNSNYASVFHFTVSENNFDSSSHENYFTHTDVTAKENHHKIFSETENVALYDFKPLSVASEEDHFKMSNDVWDESEQDV